MLVATDFGVSRTQIKRKLAAVSLIHNFAKSGFVFLQVRRADMGSEVMEENTDLTSSLMHRGDSSMDFLERTGKSLCESQASSRKYVC